MFLFVVKYLGFLKNIPLFPHLFESWLKIITLLTTPKILDYLDDIESEVLRWEKTSVCNHRYGGVQFNKNNSEIGHVHGNGLLDIPFSKKISLPLIKEGRIKEHHTLKNSGWSSFQIRTKEDMDFAIKLLRSSYLLKK